MTIKMAEGGDKEAIVEPPAYIVTTGSPEVSSRSAVKGVQKKHVLMLVSMVIVAGIIVAGILVGLHIFAEAQKEIVKFSLNFKSSNDGSNVEQDVESDPNSNVVMYQVTKNGKIVYIVNDFNRDMQIVKMENDQGTSCYVSALNRSAALDPSHITGPDNDGQLDKKNTGSTVFTVSTTPVTDRSFLPKKALDMCKDVSLYWAYRSCNGQNVDDPNLSNNGTSPDDRQRRALYYAGYYRGLPCINGCCYTICSCSVRIIEYRMGNLLICYYYNNCYYGPLYQFYQRTPGVIC